MEKFFDDPRRSLRVGAKLLHLRNVERYKIVKDIEEARAHGDISENSEYEDAKERQAMCEGIIQDIEAKLSRAEIIDVTKLRGHDLDDDDENKKIVFGATVVVEDEDENERTFRIVGTDEANIDKGWISYLTPLRRLYWASHLETTSLSSCRVKR